MSNKINHPSHYNTGSIETIEVIEDWNLNFSLGNAVKYISRAGHKDPYIQDLSKALWYISRAIQENCVEEVICPDYKYDVGTVSDAWSLSVELRIILFDIFQSCTAVYKGFKNSKKSKELRLSHLVKARNELETYILSITEESM